jgi:hypothetical protein
MPRAQPRPDGEWKGTPKFFKLEFPTYDGEGDPRPWVNRVECFFKGQHTKEGGKVWMASYQASCSSQRNQKSELMQTASAIHSPPLTCEFVTERTRQHV